MKSYGYQYKYGPHGGWHGTESKGIIIELLERWKRNKKHANTHASTICWDCEHSDKGENSICPWAREFKPVDGWEVKRTILNIKYSNSSKWQKKDAESYIVTKCPLFKNEKEKCTNDD